MDLKKNYSTKIQPPTQIKANINGVPLANLASASTPIRKRVLKTSSQMNSTPINIHKIGTNQSRSPHAQNKQNNQLYCNSNKLNFKKTPITEKNINLSPILALNRKMSQGPKIQQRTFTPNGHRRQQSLSSILQSNTVQEYQVNSDYMMKDVKDSNCFQNLLGSRSKTPTRSALADSRQSNNSNSNFRGLKSSISSTNFYSTSPNSRLRQSKMNLLNTSGSFDSYRSVGSSQIKQNQVACINQHEKKAKAKYKVIEQSEEDDQLLVYCSRCAILLVKKGFKVQQLSIQDILRIKKLQNQNSPINKNHSYAETTLKKLKNMINDFPRKKQAMLNVHKKAHQQIDCYYDSIISMIQEQKAQDHEQIEQIQQQDTNQGQILQIKVADAIKKLETIKNKNQSGCYLQNIRNCQSLLTAKCSYSLRLCNKLIIDDIQNKFQNFSQNFSQNWRLILNNDQQIEQRKNNNFEQNNDQNICKKIPSDSPLRFSFQKNSFVPSKNSEHSFTIRGLRGQFMRHNQQIQQMDKQDSGQIQKDYEKQAFRTLFPEETGMQKLQDQKGSIHSPTFKQF